MRVAILRRAPMDSVSMDIYADKLVDGLKAVRPDWSITEYYPDYPLENGHANPWLNGVRKYYERYWRYPNNLRQVDADVFHIVDHSDGYLSRELRRAACPNVVTCHDLINLIKPDTFKGRARLPAVSMAMWRWAVEAMRHADHIVTVSSHTKQDVVKHLQIAPSDITVVPNAVDTAFQCLPPGEVQVVRQRHNLSPETMCLLNVGSNNTRKNISGILAAIAKLKERRIPVHFWKVGADFSETQRQFIQSKSLTEHITYLGKPDEHTLVQIYNAADCLLAPSFYEGFGLTILEAMACGTPVITANVSAMPEVAGNAAIYIDPHNPVAIAEAVSQLYAHPETRQALKAKGLERVQSYTWKSTAEQVARVYERILQEEGAFLKKSVVAQSEG